jgi:uncharacterized protein (DUF433 family)
MTWNPRQMNGQPCIRGMRLTVRRVVEAVALYPNRDDLFRNYPELEPDDVRQALAFAAAQSGRKRGGPSLSTWHGEVGMSDEILACSGTGCHRSNSRCRLSHDIGGFRGKQAFGDSIANGRPGRSASCRLDSKNAGTLRDRTGARAPGHSEGIQNNMPSAAVRDIQGGRAGNQGLQITGSGKITGNLTRNAAAASDPCGAPRQQ